LDEPAPEDHCLSASHRRTCLAVAVAAAFHEPARTASRSSFRQIDSSLQVDLSLRFKQHFSVAFRHGLIEPIPSVALPPTMMELNQKQLHIILRHAEVS